EALLVVDIEPADAIGRRLRDVRRRALARDRRELPDLPVVHVGSPHGPREDVEAVIAPRLDELEQMRVGLELGLSDYVNKNGFGEVVVGVSGGIDSALTAALAVEALGPGRVHLVSMPSRYSSAATRDDARQLAENLGCDFREIGIEQVVEAAMGVLAV